MSTRTRWIWCDVEKRLVEESEYRSQAPSEIRTGLLLDIPPGQEFKSPVDGTIITSRAQLRAHNARNHVTDVGNDGAISRLRKPTEDRVTGREIDRAWRELERNGRA